MRIRLFTPLALLLMLALLPTGSALSASGHPGSLADMSARPSAHPLTHVVTSDTSGTAPQAPMPGLSWTCYAEAVYPLGICGDITSIALSDTDDGWAVMGGTLLRLSGGTWSAVTNPAGGWFGPIYLPLTQASAPYVAIPTKAGTGAGVTRNAVLLSPENRVKASLRSPLM